MGFESGICSEEAEPLTLCFTSYLPSYALLYIHVTCADEMGPGSMVRQARDVPTWSLSGSRTLVPRHQCRLFTSLMAALIASQCCSSVLALPWAIRGYSCGLGKNHNGPPLVALAQSIPGQLWSWRSLPSSVVAQTDFFRWSPSSWFTNQPSPDLLLAITSFAVMVWANRYHRDYSVFVKTISPLLAAFTWLVLHMIASTSAHGAQRLFMISIIQAIIVGFHGLISLLRRGLIRSTMNSTRTGKVARNATRTHSTSARHCLPTATISLQRKETLIVSKNKVVIIGAGFITQASLPHKPCKPRA